ncbi:uncharacterized protein LOC129583136 [Paramacrobiotus metropolitanus]|uniref:uncharacterized protein LOC129583136 n=1 Tax=Paramacrobiotus metropolitanus TaxID=2943436 RepID=UPI0024458F61|nr:uncharacterized protein LOC129583136 [Paramacrobiotus metropolitanus]
MHRGTRTRGRGRGTGGVQVQPQAESHPTPLESSPIASFKSALAAHAKNNDLIVVRFAVDDEVLHWPASEERLKATPGNFYKFPLRAGTLLQAQHKSQFYDATIICIMNSKEEADEHVEFLKQQLQMQNKVKTVNASSLQKAQKLLSAELQNVGNEIPSKEPMSDVSEHSGVMAPEEALDDDFDPFAENVPESDQATSHSAHPSGSSSSRTVPMEIPGLVPPAAKGPFTVPSVPTAELKKKAAAPPVSPLKRAAGNSDIAGANGGDSGLGGAGSGSAYAKSHKAPKARKTDPMVEAELEDHLMKFPYEIKGPKKIELVKKAPGDPIWIEEMLHNRMVISGKTWEPAKWLKQLIGFLIQGTADYKGDGIRLLYEKRMQFIRDQDSDHKQQPGIKALLGDEFIMTVEMYFTACHLMGRERGMQAGLVTASLNAWKDYHVKAYAKKHNLPW